MPRVWARGFFLKAVNKVFCEVNRDDKQIITNITKSLKCINGRELIELGRQDDQEIKNS